MYARVGEKDMQTWAFEIKVFKSWYLERALKNTGVYALCLALDRLAMRHTGYLTLSKLPSL